MLNSQANAYAEAIININGTYNENNLSHAQS